MADAEPRYRRILLKVSGEVLMGDQPFGIDLNTLDAVADDIAEVVRQRRRALPGHRRRQHLPRRSPWPARAWSGPAPTTWACWRR